MTQIAELARMLPGRRLVSLNHHLDLQWMEEACRRTRKDGAPGVDGVTWEEYSHGLPERLTDLLNRAKAGDPYQAPAVRRVHIPKGNGETRPLGIPPPVWLVTLPSLAPCPFALVLVLDVRTWPSTSYPRVCLAVVPDRRCGGSILLPIRIGPARVAPPKKAPQEQNGQATSRQPGSRCSRFSVSGRLRPAARALRTSPLLP